MKNERSFRLGFISAGLICGAAFGAYAVYKNLRLSDNSGSRSVNSGIPDGVYVCAKTGEPLFLSSSLVKHSRGRLEFSAPITPNSVEYTVDISVPEQRVGVRSPSDDEVLGFVRENTDGTLIYDLDETLLRFVPLSPAE